MINLSRNLPISLVVGAAGFLGSHLVEKLLSKGIQVVGVDDLSSGRLENLEEANKDKKFFFFRQAVEEKLPLGLPRLDYSFFVLPENLNGNKLKAAFEGFLNLNKNHSPKIVLVSSIDLYDEVKETNFGLRAVERMLANYAVDNKLNARVIRLAAVYGPRMHFRDADPMIRLIGAQNYDELKGDNTPLDFTTRAIYIDDAVELLIKAVFHGSTAQKIYDGALFHPVKVTEVKQVLLDPIWHENRGFKPTDLPPWPTPNLLKTQKELVWKAQTPLVSGLRQTVRYFKDNPNLLTKNKEKAVEEKPVEENNNDFLMAEVKNTRKSFTDYKNYVGKRWGNEEEKEILSQNKKGKGNFWKRVKIVLVLAFILYALIYPLADLFYSLFKVNTYLKESNQAILDGDLNIALSKSFLAKEGSDKITNSFSKWSFTGSLGAVQPYMFLVGNFIQALNQLSQASVHTILGVNALLGSMKIISGELEGDLGQSLNQAHAEFTFAQSQLGLASAELQDKANLPGVFGTRIKKLQEEINFYQQTIEGGKVVEFVLSQIIGTDGDKSYLILLLDNTRLRPGGGVVDAYAVVNFQNGRLMSIKAASAKELNTLVKVEPPVEVKTDLGKIRWGLEDSNLELDYPTNAKWARWFLENTNSKQVGGVISLDLNTISKFLSVTGPLSLFEGKETVGSDDLFLKLESQPSEKFTKALLEEFLKRVFFVPQKDWVATVDAFNKSLKEKHLQVSVNDSTFAAYLKNSNFEGALPKREAVSRGERRQFLAWSESNIGGNRINQDIKRSFDLESEILGTGKILHRLSVDYVNKNISESVTLGRYKFRVKGYFTSGSKLTKARWGERDITSAVTAFSDYGWAGYTLVLDLKPTEQKKLSLEYEEIQPLDLKQEDINYSLKLFKQPGMGSEKFDFRLNYPASFKAVGESNFPVDFASDQDFSVNLQKR